MARNINQLSPEQIRIIDSVKPLIEVFCELYSCNRLFTDNLAENAELRELFFLILQESGDYKGCIINTMHEYILHAQYAFGKLESSIIMHNIVEQIDSLASVWKGKNLLSFLMKRLELDVS